MKVNSIYPHVSQCLSLIPKGNPFPIFRVSPVESTSIYLKNMLTLLFLGLPAFHLTSLIELAQFLAR